MTSLRRKTGTMGIGRIPEPNFFSPRQGGALKNRNVMRPSKGIWCAMYIDYRDVTWCNIVDILWIWRYKWTAFLGFSVGHVRFTLETSAIAGIFLWWIIEPHDLNQVTCARCSFDHVFQWHVGVTTSWSSSVQEPTHWAVQENQL